MSLKHANQRLLAHSDWSQQTQMLAMPRQTSEDRSRVYPLHHFEWSSQVRPIACDLLTGQWYELTEGVSLIPVKCSNTPMIQYKTKHLLNCIKLYYTTVHYTTLYCTTLHYTALHCPTLHCTALRCIALHCTALRCTALYCTTLHYTTLPYAALHYAALHYIALHYTALHYTALHCTTLHCIALHLPGLVGPRLSYCTSHWNLNLCSFYWQKDASNKCLLFAHLTSCAVSIPSQRIPFSP